MVREKVAFEYLRIRSPSPLTTHLVDGYCGSGLFAISISADSIWSAKHNATLNGCQAKCPFLSGHTADIFSVLKNSEELPHDKTVPIIHPPRKGTDENLVGRMMEFGCEGTVYVSSNVHTQVRDIGMMLGKETGTEEVCA